MGMNILVKIYGLQNAGLPLICNDTCTAYVPLVVCHDWCLCVYHSAETLIWQQSTMATETLVSTRCLAKDNSMSLIAKHSSVWAFSLATTIGNTHTSTADASHVWKRVLLKALSAALMTAHFSTVNCSMFWCHMEILELKRERDV